jgi:CheY-like chemotaxis protein
MPGRVLVVDDVLPNVKRLEAKLSSEYFDVLSARDGPEALRVIEEQPPDLILLDVMMPGLDGFESAGGSEPIPQPCICRLSWSRRSAIPAIG